jgi:hypothetical protein
LSVSQIGNEVRLRDKHSWRRGINSDFESRETDGMGVVTVWFN